MSFSRRKFIKAGVMAATCVGLPLRSALAGTLPNGLTKPASLIPGAIEPTQPTFLSENPNSLELLGYYDKSAFTPYVNTKFRVYLGASNIRGLTLKNVGDYLEPAAKQGALAGAECFSLLFTIPPGKPFQQDTYRIEHEALGTFYMFVVPVSAQGRKTPDYYESVIFRMNTEANQLPHVTDARTSEVAPPAATTTTAAPTGQSSPVWMPWPIQAERKVESPAAAAVARSAKVEPDIYKYGTLGDVPPVDMVKPAEKPPAPVHATWLTMADDRGIKGLKLGMTTEQVLALFPGSRADDEVRASLSRAASPLGVSNFTIRPEKYSSKKKFEGISQIVFTLLDNRVSTLYVGYDDSTTWGHVDDFVTAYSRGRKMPPAENWAPYIGMDDQLKTLKCKDYEVSVFAGGANVGINYVQLVDLTARQILKRRKAEAKRKKLAEVKLK